MSIKNDLNELKNLDIEIKRQQKQLQHLRKQKQLCEQRILCYLEETDQPGIKFNDMTIIAQHRQRRRPAKKMEKISRAEAILERCGIHNRRETVEELLEAIRGPAEPISTLRIL